MNKTISLFLLFFCAVVWLIPSVYGEYEQIGATDKELPVAIVLKTSKMIYHTNEKVSIEVFIKNLSEETIIITEPAIDKSSISFEIIDPLGKKDQLLSIYGIKLKSINLATKRRVKYQASFIPEMNGTYEVKASYSGFRATTIYAEPVSVFVVNH
ncbi:MAG: hypothetical protein HY810_09510 [Candidatus Omnitrophica bacterium]|nr:hypothetical protein [Candidatus Omnitrophota bacterium]